MKPVKLDLANNFYVVGGTLRFDAPSYVERQADKDLFNSLREGLICYVLTSRQMGKSSLMIRTATRLREAKVNVAILDLTAIGQNLTTEQWYGGLLLQVGQRLNLEDELLEFWQSQPLLGPMQRWMRAIKTIVLPQLTGQLVIFVDEIDAVRSLPFATDEFFAGIRECYNQRSEEPILDRLTFCLLGVATPSDLIKDVRTTPFNVGKRIELHDFSEAEAAPLAQGMNRPNLSGGKMLRRVLHWTGGHPYLTQRLCQAVAHDEALNSDNDIDRICAELFLSQQARERDDNLLFVRDQLLRSNTDLAKLLTLYRRVWQGKEVKDEESNPLVSVLRLAGVARADHGYLRPRNRIYSHVFDQRWIMAAMPDAEYRRQRSAYWKGVRRTALVSILIIACIVGLAWYAWQQAAQNRRLLYLTNLNLAQRELAQANTERAIELLNNPLPKDGWPWIGNIDPRGLEWNWLWQQAVPAGPQLDRRALVAGVAFRPDNKSLIDCLAVRNAANGDQMKCRVTDLIGKAESHSFSMPMGLHFGLAAFSPDKSRLAMNGKNNQVVIVDVNTGAQVQQSPGYEHSLSALAYAPDGKLIAAADFVGTIRLLDASTGQLQRTIQTPQSIIRQVAFSPDGQTLGSVDLSEKAYFWNISNGELRHTLSATQTFAHLNFAPNGNVLYTATANGIWKIWDASTFKLLDSFAVLQGDSPVSAFSADGNFLAIGNTDRTVRVWDVRNAAMKLSLSGFGSAIMSLGWSDDGKSLVAGSEDGRIRYWDVQAQLRPVQASDCLEVAFNSQREIIALCKNPDIGIWNLTAGRRLSQLNTSKPAVSAAALSRDLALAATSGESANIQVWDAASGQLKYTLQGHKDSVKSCDFSPDGKWLVSCAADKTIRLWNLATGTEQAQFQSEVENFSRAVFSADGKTIASSRRDGSVAIWDVQTRNVLQLLSGHTQRVRALAFSPSGDRLATCAQDNKINLWEVKTGKLIKTLGHSTFTYQLTFSPDGKRLVSGGVDGTIKLWDVDTYYELISLQSFGTEITSLAFSADGQALVAGRSKDYIRFWDANLTVFPSASAVNEE